MHRFALVRAAYARQATSPAVAAGPVSHRIGDIAGRLDRMRRLPRKAIEVVRNPVAVTPYVASLAFRSGYRTAQVEGIAQVPVPGRLPPAIRTP